MAPSASRNTAPKEKSNVASEFWKLAPYAREFSVVHGAKIGRQDAFGRKAASLVFNRIARFVFDVHLSDINSAFRLLKRDVARELVATVRCMPTLLNAELLLRARESGYGVPRRWAGMQAAWRDRNVGCPDRLLPRRKRK